MPEIMNVGIIGYGMIGKVHAFAHAAQPWYAPDLPIKGRILSVATAHEETARTACDQIGAKNAFTDFRKITEDPEIDIVHICTPNDQHLDPLLSALENNKYIYCDKPLCSTKEEADRIMEKIRETAYKKTSQMTFHLRFFTANQRAKQILSEGRLGRIYQYRIGYYHSSSTDPSTPYKWKHGAAGGVIRDLVSHQIDLIDYLIGSPSEILADSMIAWEKRSLAGSENKTEAVLAEDSVSLLTHHRIGNSPVAGVVEATKLASGYEDELRWEIHGEKGSLRFSLMNSHYLEFFDGTKEAAPFGGDSGWTRIACGGRYEKPDSTFPSPKSTTGWIRAHVASLSHFLQAIAKGEKGAPDLLQGYHIQLLLDKIAESAREKKWIQI
ncbi:MAG: Gfo/Idh/MocA family oxidoreductase [Planctomycetia bacterium]|nr:Gfo/Idh/MocA family oxidoreductase [Planctomycetia bacterium]